MEGYRALIREALFPKRCVMCGAEGSWGCPRCLSEIELVSQSVCPACARVRAPDHACDAPRDAALTSLMAVGFYHDPRLRTLVHGLKYEGATCLLPAIGDVLLRWKEERLHPWPWAGEQAICIQPVPASPERVRARGFDQSDLIASLVGECLAPWAKKGAVLARTALSGQAQADLEPGALRTANVRGVFSVLPGQEMPPVVILVDDVYTTGATMREAARTLWAAGAKRIHGLALALGA